MAITGDQSFLKNINRMALIRLIRGKPGLSRADLAETTGLTKSTVSQLVQELIDEGWLIEDDALVTGSIGRRPTPLRLDGARLALIGIDLKVGHLEVVATTLLGEVIASQQRTLEIKEAAAVIELVGEVVASVVGEVRALKRKILGVGIGVPGPVHVDSGMLHYSPNFGWRDLPLRRMLQDAFAARGLKDFPIFLQRRAATAALGEVEFASETVEEPLLFIHLGSSIGAGVFVAGRLLSGHGGFAGDVGHQQIVQDGPQCSCGRRGCANTVTSLAVMASRLGTSEQEFVRRAVAGDTEAAAIARAAGEHLAILIRNLWATFDPARIVLGGLASQIGETYVGTALRTLDERAAQSPIPLPPVSVARFGAHAVAIGATALVLHQLVRPV